MPEIKLDGHRPRGSLAERALARGLTLHQLIAAARTELLSSCRYLSGIVANGRALTREQLAIQGRQPAAALGRLELQSKPLSEIFLPPLEHAVRQIQAGTADLKLTLALLADGQEAKACEHLASQIGVWPLMVEQYQRLLTALGKVGWPADDVRGLDAVPALFIQQAGELRDMLNGRDFSAIAPFLSGPVRLTHRKTLRALGYLKNRVQKPHRRRKTK